MDIQTRKIEFVQEFLKLESEEAILRLERLLKKERKAPVSVKPMSVQELNRRIDTSMQDSLNGKLIEANDLIEEIGKWR